ncbi:MAG: oligoribonuclease [Gammaproteobacteria bacterium]|jgi:oligoribonuclease
MTQSADNLIWIDLEMTGLDPDGDSIIEIATVISDKELKILAEGPVIAIRQDEAILAAMDEWNTNQHGKSGLVDRVRKSTYSVSDAERMTLDFLQKYVPPNTSPMCGNSICQDRRFMYRWMPELEKYFHYRNLDVSTVKELVKRWTTGDDQFKKNASHLAMDDIHDSIEELQHYREKYFNI